MMLREALSCIFAPRIEISCLRSAWLVYEYPRNETPTMASNHTGRYDYVCDRVH